MVMSLERGIAIAREAHNGQFYGRGPFIDHPLEVLDEYTRSHPKDIEGQAVIADHDVIEKNPNYDLKYFAEIEHCSPRQLTILDAMTFRKGKETLGQYLFRVYWIAPEQKEPDRVVNARNLEHFKGLKLRMRHDKDEAMEEVEDLSKRIKARSDAEVPIDRRYFDYSLKDVWFLALDETDRHQVSLAVVTAENIPKKLALEIPSFAEQLALARETMELGRRTRVFEGKRAKDQKALDEMKIAATGGLVRIGPADTVTLDLGTVGKPLFSAQEMKDSA